MGSVMFDTVAYFNLDTNNEEIICWKFTAEY